MKKSYLMMAAAATMLAACTQTEIVQEVNTQQAISFEGFAGKTTRAEITNVDDLKKATGGFLVWGYTSGTPGDVVFNGDNVMWDDVKEIWNYDDANTDLQYWDAAKTYSFYAVAPATANATCTSEGVYTINNVASGKASVVTDYLTAKALGPENNGIAGSLGQQVNFDFKHVMSKVSVVLATTAQNVTIHSVEMTGWNSGVGTYISNGTPAAWTIASPGTGVADIYDAQKTDGNDNFVAYNTVSTNPYLVVPQAVPTLRFTLTYKVGNVLFTDNYVEITTQEWAVNEHTTYTLNIGAGPITFGVSSVVDWDPATPAPDVPTVK